jgi:hypothetical protein
MGPLIITVAAIQFAFGCWQYRDRVRSFWKRGERA